MTNQPAEASPEQEKKRPPRSPWLIGVIGLLLAVTAGVLQALGIVQASNLNWERGTLLAWLAIGASVAAFVVGLIAVALNRGRRLGIAAMAAAILANPWVLAGLLGALG
jgi:hypothetical protein